MDRLQNRVAFGDNVLGQLGEAPEAVKEEASAFEEKHVALRSAASDASSTDEERPPPAGLIDAWDAALRRLIDRLRTEAPGKVGDVLGSRPTIEAPKPASKTKAKARPATRSKPKPTPTPEPKAKVDAKPTPKTDAKPRTEADAKAVGKKKATVKRRRGR